MTNGIELETNFSYLNIKIDDENQDNKQDFLAHKKNDKINCLPFFFDKTTEEIPFNKHFYANYALIKKNSLGDTPNKIAPSICKKKFDRNKFVEIDLEEHYGKGYKILKKMGYVKGKGLGKYENGRTGIVESRKKTSFDYLIKDDSSFESNQLDIDTILLVLEDMMLGLEAIFAERSTVNDDGERGRN